MLNDAGAELGENFYIDSEKVSTRWLRTCDQIGLFLKILTTNVLSKVAQILKRWLCWTILKIGTFRVKLLRLLFMQVLENIGLLLNVRFPATLFDLFLSFQQKTYVFSL